MQQLQSLRSTTDDPHFKYSPRRAPCTQRQHTATAHTRRRRRRRDVKQGTRSKDAAHGCCRRIGLDWIGLDWAGGAPSPCPQSSPPRQALMPARPRPRALADQSRPHLRNATWARYDRSTSLSSARLAQAMQGNMTQRRQLLTTQNKRDAHSWHAREWRVESFLKSCKNSVVDLVHCTFSRSAISGRQRACAQVRNKCASSMRCASSAHQNMRCFHALLFETMVMLSAELSEKATYGCRTQL